MKKLMANEGRDGNQRLLEVTHWDVDKGAFKCTKKHRNKGYGYVRQA